MIRLIQNIAEYFLAFLWQGFEEGFEREEREKREEGAVLVGK